MHRLCMFLCISLASASLGSEKTADYYRKLWLENTSKCKCWPRPTYLEEFRKSCTDSPENYGSFDFVIVGGGTAGCVLASRLSEIDDWKVLLIEAGGNQTEFSLIPAAQSFVQTSEINYAYLTTPQKYACGGAKNNQCAINRGKCLGGTSSIDDMTYIRGNKQDYERWAEAGNTDWSYSAVLKYFKKAESLLIPEIYSHRHYSAYHGKKGPMPVTYPKTVQPLIAHIIKANQETGYKIVDYNAQEQVGVSKTQVHVAKGIRHSTNQAYLKPVRDKRCNLVVLTNAYATKLVFKKSKAESVQFLHDGKLFYATAKKEILLAAGAIGTPKLLLLSGVGPKRDLNKLKIPCVHDLPVGQNLVDSPFVDVRFKTNFNASCPNLDEELNNYVHGEGILTLPRYQAISFGKVDRSSNNNLPDIMVTYSTPNNFEDFKIRKINDNADSILDSALANVEMNDIIARIRFLHQDARGTITLKSSDPLDYPNIDPQYFSNRKDVITTSYALEHVARLQNTRSLKEIGGVYEDPYVPICSKLKYFLKDHCLVNYLSGGTGRPIGTCRMGDVVDQELFIHGVCNVRVVGGSVIPVSMSGPTGSATVMIAEKICDTIKSHYNKL